MQADRLRQFLQGLLVEIMTGLPGIGLDLVQPDAEHIGYGLDHGGLQFAGCGFQIGVDAL